MKKALTFFVCILAMCKMNAQIIPPYYEGFESGTSAWTNNNPGGTPWQVKIPNGATAHVGSWVTGVGYDGSSYANNTVATFTSPTFDFTNMAYPYISFWKYQSSEQLWDGVRMDYSVDNGLTWTTLGAVGTGLNWYDASALNSSGLPGWSVTDTSWKNAMINLPLAGISTAQLRFIFTSDASVTMSGFLIDDIYIGDGTGNFVGASQSYSQPCGPQPVNFSVWGFGIILSGNATANVNFGDGTSTTIPFGINNGSYGLNFSHSYTVPGTFSIQYIFTDSAGNSDTLVQLNQVSISSNCGNIDGRVYNDNNNDCVYNSGDVAVSNFPIDLVLSNNQFFRTYTDISGNYFFQGTVGNTYTVKIGNYSLLGYASVCPTGGSYSVTTIPSNGNDFGIYCAPGFDLQGSMWSWGFAPGQTSHLYANVSNMSCQALNGTAIVVLDNRLNYQSANPLPTTISGDTLTWNLGTLNGSAYASINITVQTDTSVVIGDEICTLLEVTPIAGDTVPSNNLVNYCRLAAVSVDPNEKTVSPEGPIANNTQLNYTIFFQNTGTAPAYNIHILDTLDANLDVNTFRIIESSHIMQAQILPGNILHFGFNNIQLPDSNVNEPASHGYVSYTIKPLPGLINGTVIQNRAGIIFDYNAAVLTNVTNNIIDLGLGLPTSHSENGIRMYPNPVNDELVIFNSEFTTGENVRVTDIYGRIICSFKIETQETKIQTKTWTSGIYFVQILNKNNKTISKIIKE